MRRHHAALLRAGGSGKRGRYAGPSFMADGLLPALGFATTDPGQQLATLAHSTSRYNRHTDKQDMCKHGHPGWGPAWDGLCTDGSSSEWMSDSTRGCGTHEARRRCAWALRMVFAGGPFESVLRGATSAREASGAASTCAGRGS